MNDFIDTCVIISSLDNKDKYYEATSIFLEGSKNIIISIYQEKEEIPNLFMRREKLFTEAVRFLKNSNYKINYSGFTDKEIIFLKKLETKIILHQENEDSLKNMLREVLILKKNVNYFIQKKVFKRVIPLVEIEEDLIKIIKKSNNNLADAKIITSAIQEHQKNNLIAFTLDKNDWKIQRVKDEIENLKYKCPEVRFLR